jgi:hypothetical protein
MIVPAATPTRFATPEGEVETIGVWGGAHPLLACRNSLDPVLPGNHPVVASTSARSEPKL